MAEDVTCIDPSAMHLLNDMLDAVAEKDKEKENCPPPRSMILEEEKVHVKEQRK